jgi:hypothetical protein
MSLKDYRSQLAEVTDEQLRHEFMRLIAQEGRQHFMRLIAEENINDASTPIITALVPDQGGS